jgi:hypothetical protein
MRSLRTYSQSDVSATLVCTNCIEVILCRLVHELRERVVLAEHHELGIRRDAIVFARGSIG